MGPPPISEVVLTLAIGAAAVFDMVWWGRFQSSERGENFRLRCRAWAAKRSPWTQRVVRCLIDH